MLSKKLKASLPARPEPPKLDSIHQDIQSAPSGDVAFSYFVRQSQTQMDESAASIDSQLAPGEEDPLASIGLRHRFGDVISPTGSTSRNLVAEGVSSAISNVMAAASDVIGKQKSQVDNYSEEDLAADAGANTVSPAELEETYRKVLKFLEANRKLQVMLGKQEELCDQSFESVNEGREQFMEPLDDEEDELFREDRLLYDDDESTAAVLGGDTIAECDDHLPQDKQDNFKDLVTKLDKLKQELSHELAELADKTT
jgi:hypothetical protein